MARRKKQAEHANHERWLVSYADFITLLFAFFVVMFAASNADQKKAGQVARAVQGAFHELAVFSPSGKAVSVIDDAGASGDAKKILDEKDASFNSAEIIVSAKPVEGSSEMNAVKAQLEAMLKDELAKQTVHMTEDSRGLVVSLAEAGFFSPGSAVMQPQAIATVDRIASTLVPLPYNVRVEGHTDNTPIRTAQFPSNWELSTARATHVLQHLIAKTRIPPGRLSAVGYGEYRPVAGNETAAGRASNRRVDLVVIGATAQKLEPAERH